jgi:D-alanyl-D-alanine carboxypeptidase
MVRQTELPLLVRIVVFLLLGSLTSAISGEAFLSDADGMLALKRKLETKLTDLRKTGGFPGATFGFVLPDGRSGSVATGYSDVEKKISMQPNDKMLSASIGKSYVSAVMLQLIQEGNASLDERIDHWFGAEPWFHRLPNASDITLRMLMNHTSGIPDHIENRRFIAGRREAPDRFWSPQELVATILDEPPLFPAGKGWAYSDTNYILVGMIIEKITHKSYYDELTTRILSIYS